MWEALLATGELTRRVGAELAEHLGCRYPLEDDRRVTAYLQRLRPSGLADASEMQTVRLTPGLTLRPIARVESMLVDRATAPKQGDEGAPDAWLVFEPGLIAGLHGLRAGDEAIVLTWLDRARRDVLSVRPRGDAARPETGVFSTRSPDRPNPIGLHRVTIVSIEDARMCVRNLEALDGTPVIDVKPVLDPGAER
jgi:tRNA-Thr(GGU) m(6)t(6)A37 methyltransferase TsaA